MKKLALLFLLLVSCSAPKEFQHEHIWVEIDNTRGDDWGHDIVCIICHEIWRTYE